MYMADGGPDIEGGKNYLERAIEELGYAIVKVEEDSKYVDRIDEIMTDLEQMEDEERAGHLRKHLEEAYQKMDGTNGTGYGKWNVDNDAEDHLDRAYFSLEEAGKHLSSQN